MTIITSKLRGFSVSPVFSEERRLGRETSDKGTCVQRGFATVLQVERKKEIEYCIL